MIEAVGRVSPYALPGMKESLFKSDPKNILYMLCDFFGLEEKDITGRCRVRKYVWPRHLYCYLCYKYSKCSLTEIGMVLRRDHTTIIHSKQAVKNLYETEDEIREQVDLLESKFSGVNPMGGKSKRFQTRVRNF